MPAETPLTLKKLWKIILAVVFAGSALISSFTYISNISHRQDMQEQVFQIFKSATEKSLDNLNIQSEINRDSTEKLNRSLDRTNIILENLLKTLNK